MIETPISEMLLEIFLKRPEPRDFSVTEDGFSSVLRASAALVLKLEGFPFWGSENAGQ